jgi:hypothetical protein
MRGDRLWHLHEMVWVVAATREEAATYIRGEGLYLGDEDDWCLLTGRDYPGGGIAEYLTLCTPRDGVGHLPDEDGQCWDLTALEYAEVAPSGWIVRYDEDDDDDERDN